MAQSTGINSVRECKVGLSWKTIAFLWREETSAGKESKGWKVGGNAFAAGSILCRKNIAPSSSSGLISLHALASSASMAFTFVNNVWYIVSHYLFSRFPLRDIPVLSARLKEIFMQILYYYKSGGHLANKDAPGSAPSLLILLSSTEQHCHSCEEQKGQCWQQPGGTGEL